MYPEIDVDSHVTEAGNSWELYLPAAYNDRRPVVIDNPHVSQRPLLDKVWYIDGTLVPKNQGRGAVVMSTPVEMSFSQDRLVSGAVQACTDPVARAAHMHELGVSRSVLYSTLFLQAFADDIAYEAALMQAWNRWMSDRCSEAPGALAFGALAPIRDTQLAVREVTLAKELGASSVIVLPTAGELHLDDPTLDPFWAACQDLDMPVAIHIGWPQPSTTQACRTPSAVFAGAFELSMWWAYLSIFTGGVLDRFPRLRIAFFEQDCRWLDLFLQRATKWFPTAAARPWPTSRPPAQVLAEHEVYFSFDGDFAYLPSFLDLVGEDRVLGALDFPHTHYGVADLSAAFDLVRDHDGLGDAQKQAVLSTNALRYYGWGPADVRPGAAPELAAAEP